MSVEGWRLARTTGVQASLGLGLRLLISGQLFRLSLIGTIVFMNVLKSYRNAKGLSFGDTRHFFGGPSVISSIMRVTQRGLG